MIQHQTIFCWLFYYKWYLLLQIMKEANLKANIAEYGYHKVDRIHAKLGLSDTYNDHMCDLADIYLEKQRKLLDEPER